MCERVGNGSIWGMAPVSHPFAKGMGSFMRESMQEVRTVLGEDRGVGCADKWTNPTYMLWVGRKVDGGRWPMWLDGRDRRHRRGCLTTLVRDSCRWTGET